MTSSLKDKNNSAPFLAPEFSTASEKLCSNEEKGEINHCLMERIELCILKNQGQEEPM